jgi:signal transduction histidine kinase
MKFLNTFRGRLVIVLAILLVATISVQYYLNLLTEEQNRSLRELQTQALVSGFAVCFYSFTSNNSRLSEIVNRNEQNIWDENATKHIKNILIIDDKFKIYDSLDESYLLPKDTDGTRQRRPLSDIKDLPPLVEINRLGDAAKNFPNAEKNPNRDDDSEAHTISMETTDGIYYIMVVLRTDKKESAQRAARPLIYTLAVLLISSLITILLVWRFTRPIAELSNAARKIAQGDLHIRVRGSDRTDELGKLAMRFNEMTAELEKKVELEAKLKETEKSAVVGRLASAIAHEIRNPLNYINLTLDQLRAKFVPEDEDKAKIFDKLTSQLKTEVGRINQQISDFLRYSRPLKLDLKPINLREVVDNSLNIVEAQAEEQGINIAINQAESASKILGDAEILRSVFNNLFINAIQAMPSGGSLKIDIISEANFAKIEVADTGEGISNENLPKIFEPYFSTKETGTGLGLAIVKRIIDEHNGTIEVESEEGKGTKFEVKLPKA